jgi:hypothetical protein
MLGLLVVLQSFFLPHFSDEFKKWLGWGVFVWKYFFFIGRVTLI